MTTISPPISPQPVETRPRAGTAMSSNSTRSRRSNSSASKLNSNETSGEKKRLNTKADPTQAITEATPVEQAQEESTLEDMRKMVHKDKEGNLITDPDRSNPTRYRLERPLDTIRAFQAAQEGTSSRRPSYGSRPASQVGWNGDHRRASGHYSQNGYSPQRQQNRMSSAGGYYRNSSYGLPQSAVEESPGASQMYARPPQRQFTHPHAGPPNGQYNGYQNGHQNGHQNGYPNGYQNGNQDSPMSAHSYQQSYDTMTSGSEEYGKSTNPSSQNSSFDQLQQLRTKPEDNVQNVYAKEIQFNQVSPQQPFSPYGSGHENYGRQMAPPAIPEKDFVPPPANNPRQIISLNGNTDDTTPPTSPSPPKKQSWLKRRFSKKVS